MQQAQQLGRYHLLDRVAFGGMAEIYRAKTADAQGRLHVVAVKRVLGHLCEDDEFIQMLIDEARLTALLKHPNIARVYEFSKVQSEYFISMEYVDGKDMRALLERARQNQEWLPEHLIAYIGMQVARGLHAAHMQTDRNGNALNIVHRDVSPSNVLLSYGGDVKLCDFGIAKASGARSQTKTGVIKGKVKYMSPEQAMGRKLDHRSDLFSLGTLLYEMLTLQAPFTATTEIELLFAVRDARKRPIRELRPNLHAELEIVIDRAMAKSRSQRFQNGEEFANSLQAFLDAHYPNQGVAALSQYLRAAFAKEIERENALLAEYVIDGAKATTNVGENLLADVLGPDAEYTQFTAAFTQDSAPLPELLPATNPNQQMRVLAEITMPGAEEFDAMPTAQKNRLSA
jgi:serine/threonine-protein kinase